MCVCFVCMFCRSLSFCFSHCAVCPSSIYGFWLPLWYLQTLLVKVSTLEQLPDMQKSDMICRPYEISYCFHVKTFFNNQSKNVIRRLYGTPVIYWYHFSMRGVLWTEDDHLSINLAISFWSVGDKLGHIILHFMHICHRYKCLKCRSKWEVLIWGNHMWFRDTRYEYLCTDRQSVYKISFNKITYISARFPISDSLSMRMNALQRDFINVLKLFSKFAFYWLFMHFLSI